jgi:DNA-binding NarL/FixJ family response regulator
VSGDAGRAAGRAGATPIRVLVADDHPTFARTIRLLLADERGVEIVGTAADGDEAVARALELRPDVVLMDLNMPGTKGIDATRQIAEGAPHVAVVVLTMFDDDDSVVSALRSGARGYLLKGARQADIVRAIEAAHAGEAILAPAVARRLAGLVDPAPPPESSRAFPDLTDREVEVLDRVAAGLDNRAISAALFLSEKTVRNYVSTILTKIHASSRAEAIVRARDAGLGVG